jgi:hypothetical protein
MAVKLDYGMTSDMWMRSFGIFSRICIVLFV